ncbi:MAG: cupin domain-containing protein [Anaerolineae bacterium]|nr:cupin domain-containing protein [Anaerolineae bacterium]
MSLFPGDIKYGEPSKNMCGDGFIEELAETPASPNLRAAFVKFVCGAFTKWHYHTGEQMLFATEGEGFVEFQDRPTIEIREGARVFIPTGVWHRHGAAEGKTLIHLAVTYGATIWDHDDPCQRDAQRKDHLGLSVVSEINYLNQRIVQAEESGLKDDLVPLLADSFTIIRSNGEKSKRQAFLDAVPDNANRGRRTAQPNVQLAGRCAIYTCIVTTTQNPAGTPNPGRFWNTRLFVRENGQWRCLTWQVMKICDT